MKSRNRQWRHPAQVIRSGLGLAVLTTILFTPAVATANPAPPQLRIAIDNGRAVSAAGDRLRYTITVTNLGARRLSGLLITQTVPNSTRFLSADSNGRNHRGEVRWKLDLPATRTVTLRTVIAVAKETPPEMHRLAIVACAATSNKGAALVCASDSDQLPAGAQAQRSQAEEDVGAMQMPAWWLIAGPGLILSAFVIGIVAKLRTSWARRRKEPENG